ncbi:hypothetical protein Trydic_g11600 [Trypoxylus dichotomus]
MNNKQILTKSNSDNQIFVTKTYRQNTLLKITTGTLFVVVIVLCQGFYTHLYTAREFREIHDTLKVELGNHFSIIKSNAAKDGLTREILNGFRKGTILRRRKRHNVYLYLGSDEACAGKCDCQNPIRPYSIREPYEPQGPVPGGVYPRFPYKPGEEEEPLPGTHGKHEPTESVATFSNEGPGPVGEANPPGL